MECSGEQLIAVAVLKQTLDDLMDKRYGLCAAHFLARDWPHSWAHCLPAPLSSTRLRQLVREALDPTTHAEPRRTTTKLTRGQRVRQREILVAGGLLEGPVLTLLAGQVRVDSGPERALEGVNEETGVTYRVG